MSRRQLPPQQSARASRLFCARARSGARPRTCARRDRARAALSRRERSSAASCCGLCPTRALKTQLPVRRPTPEAAKHWLSNLPADAPLRARSCAPQVLTDRARPGIRRGCGCVSPDSRRRGDCRSPRPVVGLQPASWLLSGSSGCGAPYIVRCSSGSSISSPFFDVAAQNWSGSSTLSVASGMNWSRLRTAPVRAANGQQTSEIAFAHPCEIESSNAPKPA